MGRLAFGGMCFTFVFFAVFGLIGAYQDLTGPYCDSHPMGPADTCSVLTAELYRGEQRIERLNPPGTEPSVLTAPARWHATPEKTIQGVHSPAEMRNLHRSTGYEKLAFSALLAALPTRWAYKAYRVARAKRSSTATTAG